LDTINHWLEQPVQIWHLVLLALVFGITLHDMRKQMTAIGKSVWKIIDILQPPDED
jgi:hypothetical protein